MYIKDVYKCACFENKTTKLSKIKLKYFRTNSLSTCTAKNLLEEFTLY